MDSRVSYGHRDNRLLAALPAETLAAMAGDLQRATLAQGAVLYEPGDVIGNIYFPQTGLISLLIVTKDGNTIETSIVGREGALGLHSAFGPRRSFTRATAQIGGAFSIVQAARFARMVHDHPALRDLIASYTEVTLAEAQQIAACNATHDASSRLARWLLQCADRTGSEQLPLTQEFLAHMLGVRRTTVTLLAQALQKKGLIKYSRGRIAILDRDGLAAKTCECYSVIRHDKLPSMIGVQL
jgi:CRP-like cAMP-binding protein